MKTLLNITIPVAIQPKQADRQQIRYTKSGKPYIHHHTADDVLKNAALIATHLGKHRPSQPYEGALWVSIVVTYPWRRSESKKVRESGRFKWKDTKPDCEQLAKQINDVMESCYFFANDAQIARLTVEKRWGDNPGVEIILGSYDS